MIRCRQVHVADHIFYTSWRLKVTDIAFFKLVL